MFTFRNSGFPHEASFDQNIGIQTIALGLQCFRPGTNAHVQFFFGGRGVCALKGTSPITTRGFAGNSAGLPQQQAMIGAIGMLHHGLTQVVSICFNFFEGQPASRCPLKEQTCINWN